VLSIHPSDENLAPILDIIGNKNAMVRQLESSQRLEGEPGGRLMGCGQAIQDPWCGLHSTLVPIWQAVNQAWAGHPGSLVRTYPPASPPPIPVVAGQAVVAVACDGGDVTQLGWTYDAAAGALRQGEHCLSTDGYDIPVNLLACGNSSTHQNFTYEASTGQFQVMAPAPRKLYLGCLQASGAPAQGAPPGKVDVYKCSAGNANERFELDPTGALRSKDGFQCLAGRDRYVPASPGVAGVQLWAKPLGGGRMAALFINGGGASAGIKPGSPSHVTTRRRVVACGDM
jgi:hypothetical protein